MATATPVITLLTKLTAFILQVALFLLGLPAEGDGLVRTLDRGGLEIWGSCSGVESIKQLLQLAGFCVTSLTGFPAQPGRDIRRGRGRRFRLESSDKPAMLLTLLPVRARRQAT